jgi:hypothetical protein
MLVSVRSNPGVRETAKIGVPDDVSKARVSAEGCTGGRDDKKSLDGQLSRISYWGYETLAAKSGFLLKI